MSKLGYIQRYIQIIRIVGSHPYITLSELVRKVENALFQYDDTGSIGVSERTIKRDISDIRSGLGVSIDYSRSRNGYYIPEDEDCISDIAAVLDQLDLVTSLRARQELSSIIYTEKRKARGTEYLKKALEYHNNHEFTKASDAYYTAAAQKWTDRIYNDGNLTEDFLKKNLLLPIPDSERDANPGITDNNFGY